MRKNRLAKIVDIITEHDVETQDELLEYLRAEGFDVTQATVSRDIRELKLIKGNSEYGTYRYMLPKSMRDEQLHISSALAEAIIRVDYSQNIVVLHTFAGMAQAVAIEVDRLGLSQLLGCVAGDDTIIAVARDNDSAAAISNQLKELIRVRAKSGDGL
ncbi:MAG: arginine repressor [Clostridia bacterium]|nr:arginine repressor [Clostridia bacterium]